MKKLLLTTLIGLIFTQNGQAQKEKIAQYFGDPIVTDSLTTVFIPTRYNQEFLAANKIAYWGDYYANIVVYNHQTDSYKKLFENDTFIKAFKRNINRYSISDDNINSITKDWVFLLVKNVDYNRNGRIDGNDPSILFVTTTKGENLRRLTEETENVVSIELFEKQSFGLIKIQRDVNKDRSFKNDDKDFYYKKINLTDLSFGKGIEIK